MKVNVPTILTYTECAQLAQQHLKHTSQTHGKLTQWCKDKELDYKTVVKIKNGSISYYAPNLVLKILLAYGYSVSLTKKLLPKYKEEDIFMIERLETTDRFQSEETE
jgi:hypothetical protein